MKAKKMFEPILAPGQIGSVKMRNRIIKTGASLLIWYDDDLHMREEIKAFYGPNDCRLDGKNIS